MDNAIMKHMETIIKKIDRNQIDQVIMEEAGSILKNGGLVAFPTETVYGLGGNGLDPQASQKIYAAKGRPSDNPLILHIAKIDQLHEVVSEIPEAAATLAEAFWPGPLTMIFKKTDCVPYETTGGLDTVAVRMPQHMGRDSRNRLAVYLFKSRLQPSHIVLQVHRNLRHPRLVQKEESAVTVYQQFHLRRRSSLHHPHQRHVNRVRHGDVSDAAFGFGRCDKIGLLCRPA